jgi:iron complex outermembrane receptor protein
MLYQTALKLAHWRADTAGSTSYPEKSKSFLVLFFKKELLAFAYACGIAATQYPRGGRAQSVDYGGLEQIFGEPITTSATGKPQRVSEAPANMVIITADDIRRSGADNIPDILQFVTGIDVRRYSFGDTQVGVRGYDSPLNPRLLVLVDGREVYNNVFGFAAWNAIPVQLGEIRQIEVVKGPNSALFGFNAVSGVINIVTFDPLLDNTNVATVRSGTQGFGQGELVATQHFGTTAGVRVSLGGWTASGYKQPVPTQAGPPRYDSFNIDGRWDLTSWVLLRASGGYTDTHTERPLPIEVSQDFRDHLSYWRIGGAAQTRIGTVDVDVYQNHDLHDPNGQQDNTLLVAKISDLVKLNADNTVRAGFEFRTNTVTSAPVYGGTVSYNNFAVNGMWDWQISSSYELTNALRVDHLDLAQSGMLLPIVGRTAQTFNATTFTQPSFNSGLVIHVSDTDTVRLMASRGLQVPSLVDFGLQLNVAPQVYILGTPAAMPESVWDAELAYNRALTPISATLETSVFFQRNTDLLAPPGATPYGPVGGVIASTAENFGSSDEIGFEVGLRGVTKGGFRWNASYRYASITQDEFASIVQNQATGFANGTPLHAIIAGGGYTIGAWELDAAGRFQSRFTDYAQNAMRAAVPVVVPDYVTFNARLGYRVTNDLTVAGTAEQFNVSRLLESSLQYVDRRFIASATLRY